MGCLRNSWLVGCFALLLAACGTDPVDGKNTTPDCASNAECASGICDISVGKCQPVTANNTTGNNTTSNNTTSNNTTSTTGAVCGDGVIDANETCDGDCPTECASTAPDCQVGQLQGLSENCTATCVYSDISACAAGDGCCPSGCTPDNDDDCQAACGNGVLDGDETCDFNIMGGAGTCPISAADCNDSNACTLDAPTGDAGTCSAQCINEPIVVCTNGDGCCPGACDVSTDSDCGPKVGQPCTADAQCPANQNGVLGFCQMEADYRWPGGFCSVGCSVDTDCAAGDHCTGRVCMPDCTNNDDCRTGYACYDYYGTGSNTCAPAVGTGALAGGACTTNDDCLGALFGAVCNTDVDLPAGYCLSACAVNADCAAGTHCGSTANGGQVCVPDCAGNADCRAGYECYNWLGDFTNTCGPVANGSGTVGTTCAALQDCAGGQLGRCIDTPDWFEGTCSQSCSAADVCPNGTHCSFIDNITGRGLCLSNCTSGADCRTNYSCVDADENLSVECAPSGNGTGAIGATCAGVYQCMGGTDAFCIQEAQGWRAGYCSEVCTTNADCGVGAHCGNQDPATGDGICIADCATNGDCRTDGYSCFDWDSSPVASLECAPGGTGAGSQGDACAGVWECSGGAGAFCVTDAQGWTNGYCALDGCATNTDCSLGAHCGFFDSMTNEGICIKTCGTDIDCRANYGCFDLDSDQVNECLPAGDGRVGDPCGSFADCAGRDNAICAPEPNFPNGMCLLDCTPGSGTTCTAGNVCVAFTGLSACVPSCASNADCRQGYTCQSDGVNNICLP